MSPGPNGGAMGPRARRPEAIAKSENAAHSRGRDTSWARRAERRSGPRRSHCPTWRAALLCARIGTLSQRRVGFAHRREQFIHLPLEVGVEADADGLDVIADLLGT